LQYSVGKTVKRWLLPGVLGGALVAAAVWGGVRSAQAEALLRAQNNAYTRCVYEITAHMGNLETDMAKLMVSGSPGMNVALLADIVRRADGAVNSITHLPLAQPAAGGVTGFANTVGDYARALLEQAGRGDPLTYEQLEQLKDLHSSCVLLNTQLQSVAQEPINFAAISSDSFFSWDEDAFSARLYEINQNGPELPALIYDGPFSDALTGSAPRGLPAGVVDEETARSNAAQYLGLPDAQVLQSLGLCDGAMPAFCFNGSDENGDPVYLQVSRQGGKVLLMLRECTVQEGSITTEQCILAAQEFLQRSGIGPVTATWSQKYDGTVVINFAARQSDVVLYSDLIKVKVRTDTGQVTAVDAAGYYMNHKERTLAQPAAALQDVRPLVSAQLAVHSERLCLIPLDGGQEALAWEFTGTFADETYIVYMDAHSGDELQVFKIINTQTGPLTV